MDETPEIAARLLRAFESCEAEQVLALCTPDVVFELPFLGIRVDRDSFERKILRTLKVMEGLSFSDLRVDRLEQPGWCLAQYTGSARISTTGKDYNQTYITVIGTRHGLVTNFAEHFDTTSFSEAFTHSPDPS